MLGNILAWEPRQKMPLSRSVLGNRWTNVLTQNRICSLYIHNWDKHIRLVCGPIIYKEIRWSIRHCLLQPNGYCLQLFIVALKMYVIQEHVRHHPIGVRITCISALFENIKGARTHFDALELQVTSHLQLWYGKKGTRTAFQQKKGSSRHIF